MVFIEPGCKNGSYKIISQRFAKNYTGLFQGSGRKKVPKFINQQLIMSKSIITHLGNQPTQNWVNKYKAVWQRYMHLQIKSFLLFYIIK